MNGYQKQYLFNEKKIKLFYLSPYAKVRQIDDNIAFVAQGSDMAILLPVKAAKSVRIVELLKNGMGEETLKEMLSDILDEESEDWLYSCIWEGIIE